MRQAKQTHVSCYRTSPSVEHLARYGNNVYHRTNQPPRHHKKHGVATLMCQLCHVPRTHACVSWQRQRLFSACSRQRCLATTPRPQRSSGQCHCCHGAEACSNCSVVLRLHRSRCGPSASRTTELPWKLAAAPLVRVRQGSGSIRRPVPGECTALCSGRVACHGERHQRRRIVSSTCRGVARAYNRCRGVTCADGDRTPCETRGSKRQRASDRVLASLRSRIGCWQRSSARCHRQHCPSSRRERQAARRPSASEPLAARSLHARELWWPHEHAHLCKSCSAHCVRTTSAFTHRAWRRVCLTLRQPSQALECRGCAAHAQRRALCERTLSCAWCAAA